jgi:hypothetical protein
VATPENLTTWLKLEFCLALANPPAVNLPRLGIINLYLQIFQKTSYRYAAYVIAGVIVLNWVVLQSIVFAWCIPLEYGWNKEIPGGHCINQLQFVEWQSLVNILTDLATLILPIPVVWGFQMSLSHKVGVTFTFATGCM